MSNSATSLKIDIANTRDVVHARFITRKEGEKANMDARNIIKLSTVVSELARNIVQYAKSPGTVEISDCNKNGNHGIRIIVEDKGIGIADLDSIMNQSKCIMGGGIFGCIKFMDTFNIQSKPDQGTRVEMVKWLN